MKKLLVTLVMFLVLSTPIVQAAPPQQADEGETYVVQANDWLSKLAEKYYGDVSAWPAIWLATNAKAETDDAFATIADPNIIEIGQQLWIPPQAEADLLLADQAASSDSTTEAMAESETAETAMDEEAESAEMAETAEATEEATETDAEADDGATEAMAESETAMAEETTETDSMSTVTEAPLTEIALTGPIAVRDSEISGMAWYGDHLILMPQYPNFAVEEGEGFVFALAKTDILAYLDGTGSESLEPIQIPVSISELTDEIENFEGYEALAFVGDDVYLTIESSPEAGMKGFLVKGTIASDLSELSLNLADRTAIEPQAPIDNHTDETLFVAGEMLVTLYESTGASLISEPVAHRFDTALASADTIPYPNIEYRITDATDLDADNRFWAINYFFPGDDALLPESDPIADTFGKGATHAENEHVERLVEFQYDDSGITLTETAPIQLELTEDARNWEGLVRLDERGFLIATDKWPQMILGFVPLGN